MTDSTAIIVASISFCATTFSALALRRSSKNAAAIHQVHLSINSRMDELLKAARGEASAEGREAGRAEGQPQDVKIVNTEDEPVPMKPAKAK